MAERISLEVTVNTGKSAAEIKALKDEIDALFDKSKEASASGKTDLADAILKQIEPLKAKLNSLSGDLNTFGANTETASVKGATSLRGLTQEMNRLAAEALELRSQGDILGATKLEAAAASIKDDLEDVRKRIDALKPGDKAKAFSTLANTIVGGFTAAQSATALFGGSEEALAKTLLKVQAAQGLLQATMAVTNGVKELAIVKTVALSTVQSAFAIVTGTSTGALKLFRIALATTGIGALIVGIGLLVANFKSVSEWVSKVINNFIPLEKILTGVKNLFNGITDALGFTNTAQDAQVKILDSQIAAYEKNRVEVNKYYDNLIKQAAAAGQSTSDLEIKRQQALINNTAAEKKIYDEKAALLKTLPEEEQKKVDEINKINEDAINESSALQTKAQTDQLAKNKEANDKAIEQAKALQAELKKVRDELTLNALPENDRELLELDIKYAALREKAKGNKTALLEIERLYTIELKQLQAQQFTATSEAEYQASLDALDAFNTSEKLKLLQQLADKKLTQEQFDAATITLSQTVADTRVMIATDYAGSVKQAEQDVTDFTNASEEQRLQNTIANEAKKRAALLASIDTENTNAADPDNPEDIEIKLAGLQLRFDQELALYVGNEEKRLATRKKYQKLFDTVNQQEIDSDKRKRDAILGLSQGILNGLSSIGNIAIKNQKKQEAFQKQVAGVQILIDTASGISSAIAAGMKVGVTPVEKAIAIASGIGVVLTNMAKAKALLGQAGASASVPSLDTGGGASGITPGQTRSAYDFIQPSTIIPPNQQNQQQQDQNLNVTVNAQVVETDMTNTQQRSSYIQNRATFP